MEPAAEPISVRTMRLGDALGGPSIMASTSLNKELLFDALILLFDECNNDFMKTDSHVSSFVNKCKCSTTLLYTLYSLVADFQTSVVCP